MYWDYQVCLWECRDCQCPYNFSESFFDSTLSEPNISVISDHSVSDSDILQDFIDLRKKYPRRFLVSHININSLQYKFDELSLILTNGLVDCLFVAETKLNDSHLPAKFSVNQSWAPLIFPINH